MKCIKTQILALVCLALVAFNLDQGIAKEPEIFMPLPKRQTNGYYEPHLPSGIGSTTCNQAVTEYDTDMEDYLYKTLSADVLQDSLLKESSFSAFVTIAKDGTLVSVRPVGEQTETILLDSFRKIMRVKSPYRKLPEKFSKAEGLFYLSSDGFHFYNQVPNRDDRIRLLSQHANENLQSWLKKSLKLAQANWHPKDRSSNFYRIEIIVYIDESGLVIKKEIVTSSCSPSLDQEALSAIDSVRKFPRQPVKSLMGYTKVLMVFDYAIQN